MKRIIGAVAAAAAVTLSATACQDDVTAPATTTTHTASTTTAGQPTATAGESPAATRTPVNDQPGASVSAPAATSRAPEAGTAPATAGHGLCVDINSGVVAAALNSLGPGVGGENYVPESATDAPLGSCPQLLWVLAATPRGTASSPWHVLFFNHDRYLGTATKAATSYTSIVGSSDRGVQVRYRWIAGDEPNCCPAGGPVDITFTLGADGSTITPDRPIPPQVAK
ncbi:LppP/LprE family lipoprotein [Nocardia sp. NPDC003482]|uniref:LppP/LprE family lipoprotein n=1 Tax=Nocardia sp. NPDC004068 TaxID=3364303 RepID=UPI0036B8C6D4